MRDIETPILNALADGAPLKARTLVWLSGKDFNTGVVSTVGFWNGDDHRDFSGIDPSPRTYYGAGGMIEIPTITYVTGIQDQRTMLSLSNLAPEVFNSLRGYDIRMAPVEIHTVLLNQNTEAVVDSPIRQFVGFVDEMSDIIPEFDASGAQFNLKLSSAMRRFTRTLSLKHSDNTIRQNADDRFAKYSDITGKVVARWG